MTTPPSAQLEPEATGLDGDWGQPFPSTFGFRRFSGALRNYIGDSRPRTSSTDSTRSSFPFAHFPNAAPGAASSFYVTSWRVSVRRRQAPAVCEVPSLPETTVDGVNTAAYAADFTALAVQPTRHTSLSPCGGAEAPVGNDDVPTNAQIYWGVAN